MKKTTFIISLLTLMATGQLAAQTDVQTVGNAFSQTQGFVYTLPKTELIIEADFEHTATKAGPYYKYAGRYLNIADPITADSDTFTLRAVRVRTNGVPDSWRTYKIIADGLSSATSVQLTEDGIIAALNQQVELHPLALVNTPDTLPALRFSQSVITEDALLATSTAKMAETASKQLLRIRETRMDIISGEADNMPSGETLKILFAEMDKNERELQALFSGKTATATFTRSFRLTPAADLNREIIFRLSPDKGIADKNSKDGVPLTLSLRADRKVMDLQEKSKKKKGIYYTIPGTAAIEIRLADRLVYQGELPMAQFGVEQSLPNNFFNKAETKLLFDTATGAIKQMMK